MKRGHLFFRRLHSLEVEVETYLFSRELMMFFHQFHSFFDVFEEIQKGLIIDQAHVSFIRVFSLVGTKMENLRRENVDFWEQIYSSKAYMIHY